MADSEYEGPAFALIKTDEVVWQFGVRRADGWVQRLGKGVRPGPGELVQRRLVPIEDWKPVPDPED